MSAPRRPILLSPPHAAGTEAAAVARVLADNWIAPAGPEITAFEDDLRAYTGAPAAAALASGTAALHLALRLLGVGEGDEGLCQSLTFAGSANPIVYCGARPVWIDSETATWNADPEAVAEALRQRRRATGRTPKVLIVVHLFGQPAQLAELQEVCAAEGVALLEDAAESLGAFYGDRHTGTLAPLGVFSFNGNKIISSGGGGMLVAQDPEHAARARKWASQSREPAVHYEHAELGFNYRLSAPLAAIGRAQLATIEERVAARRAHFAAYRAALGDLPGIAFQPDLDRPGTRGTHWLTAITVDPAAAGVDRDALIAACRAAEIETRPVWKPMHLQPFFRGHPFVGSGVSDRLFHHGLCLPSGSGMTAEERARVIAVLRGAWVRR